jgi:hypothetical protein
MDTTMYYAAIVLGYIFFLLFAAITAFINIGRGEKQSRNLFSKALVFIAEIAFTIIGPIIGFMRYDAYQPEIPFSKHHVLTVIILVFFASLSFWIARLSAGNTKPLTRIILSVGMLQGILLCAICSVHFMNYYSNGLAFPFLGFELLSPPMAVILLLREFYFFNRERYELDEALPYRKELGFMPLSHRLLEKTFFQRLPVYAAFLLPFIAAQLVLAYGFGQAPDALIKAFTHSQGFFFSSIN